MKGLYKFLIVGFVLAGLASYRSWADGRLNSPPLNSEQLEVYGEFIDSFSRMNFKFLSKKTYPLDLSSLGRDAPCLHGLQFQSATESGKAVHLLGQEVLRGHSIQLVDEQQEASILKQRDEDKPTDSNTSTSDSAGTTKDPGILALSEIVFDKSNHFAVLKYVFLCGSR